MSGPVTNRDIEMSKTLEITTTLGPLKALIEAELARAVPVGETTLSAAIGYALLAPGKRVRAIFCLLVAESLGGSIQTALAPAAAIEMIHTASLILDDLPSMDNAALRRGQPTTHLRFGEASAILAAITLMSDAFGLLASGNGLTAAQRAALVGSASTAIGHGGLTGGQDADLQGSLTQATPTSVERLHAMKTGALFAAAAHMGAICAGADPTCVQRYAEAGMSLGLAFQGLDDMLDVLATAKSAGKDVGKDSGKATVVGLLGAKDARRRIDGHIHHARTLFEAHAKQPHRLLAYVDGLLSQLEQPMRTAAAQ